MVVTCEQVWQEVSNYIEGAVDPALRTAMDEHLQGCQRCAAVLAGTRNVVQLYGDERLLRTPLGFSWRLRWKLAQNMPSRRGTAYGWLVAASSVGLLVGSLAVANSSARSQPVMLSEHAQPGHNIPNDLVVLVAAHTKVFHIPGCTALHNQNAGVQSMTAAKAIEEGFAPCIYCLRKYVSNVAGMVIAKHAWVLA